MFDQNSWLTVGKIVAPQGLKGELRLNPSSDFPERFTKPGTRWLQAKNETPRKIDLLAGRQLPGKSIYVIRFLGIETRNSAQTLIGQSLLVPTTDRPQLTDGEFHLLDLLGLDAKLEANGESVGNVIGLTTAGNDLLKVKLLNGKQVLIPFVKEIVPEVRIKEGWLRIKPPPGLLDL